MSTIRITCAEIRHGLLYTKPVESVPTDQSDDESTATQAAAQREIVNIVTAHRAHYGAQCSAPIMTEIIDTEDEVVVVWRQDNGTGRGRPKQFMGVFYDERNADRFIENYVAMSKGQPRLEDRYEPEDFFKERQVITQYLHSGVDRVPETEEAVAVDA